MGAHVELREEQVSSFRLLRQHLLKRAPAASLVTVVRDLCGVQAQVMAAAQIALWARVQDLEREDVERVLWESRELVKTWAMRGTVHLVPADDLPMVVGALRQSGVREVQRWLSRKGIDSKEADTLATAISEALSSGPLTRKELAERLVSRLGERVRPWVEHSWGGVVKQAALQGDVCFGPNRGAEVTFVPLDQHLPGFRGMHEGQAGEELFRRYLHGYGPANVQDFARWSGLAVKEARSIRERLAAELVEIVIGSRTALLLRQDLKHLPAKEADEAAVRLLPSFDPYLLGHREKEHLVDRQHYKRVFRKAGWLSPVVLNRGRVCGTWSSQRRGKRMVVTVDPFHRFSLALRTQIEAEVEDLGRFLGVAGETTYRTVR